MLFVRVLCCAGNVYAKFKAEEDAAECLKALQGRWYNGQQIVAEYSPVTEFREARCRQFDERGCDRGPWCNFMHLKAVPRDMARELLSTQPALQQAASSSSSSSSSHRDDRDRDRDRRRSRSRSPGDRDRDRGRDDRDRGRYDDRDHRDRDYGRDSRDGGGRAAGGGGYDRDREYRR